MNGDVYLIDTSVWLEVLPPDRGTAELRERVDELLAADAVATMGLVRLELLGGTRTEAEWRRLSGLLSALRQFRVDETQWDQAARLAFDLRRSGTTVPFTDLLIAAVALSAGAVVLHRDRHFDFIAERAALRVESHARVQ